VSPVHSLEPGGGAPRERSFVRMGPGAEFDLIRSFVSQDATLPSGVLVGPGDDCAVLAAGSPLAVSTDLSIEDVHFRRAWLEPEEIGWRAAASALSDLAAVAAEPVALLVSLAVPNRDVTSGWTARVMSGAKSAGAAVGASLVGGDLSRSPGPAMINVVVLGRTGRPVLRDGAEVGDEVWVTGSLGGAGAAVELLQRGGELPDAIRRAFARPSPRTGEALWLTENAELHAMIDLSDGLAGDAGHVASASGVAIILDTDDLPVAPGLGEAGFSAERSTSLALHAGEDYELCLVTPPGLLSPLREPFRERFALSLTCVGSVREGEGVWLRQGGMEAVRLETGGFNHFPRGAVE
jgi:thiamine-monophosphate kinase